MGRNVSSGGGGDLEARLHPQEVSWWAWAAEVVGVLLVNAQNSHEDCMGAMEEIGSTKVEKSS